MTTRVAAALAFLLLVATASSGAWGSDAGLDRPAVALLLSSTRRTPQR
jgi:hypothetical protein